MKKNIEPHDNPINMPQIVKPEIDEPRLERHSLDQGLLKTDNMDNRK